MEYHPQHKPIRLVFTIYCSEVGSSADSSRFFCLFQTEIDLHQRWRSPKVGSCLHAAGQKLLLVGVCSQFVLEKENQSLENYVGKAVPPKYKFLFEGHPAGRTFTSGRLRLETINFYSNVIPKPGLFLYPRTF